MALRRRGAREAPIWPGFVDAMTALLLVLFFVLSIFMIVQFVLRNTIDDQDLALDDLSAEVLLLSEALGLEQSRAFALEGDLGAAEERLTAERAEIERQTALIDLLTAEVEGQGAALREAEGREAALLAERDEAAAALDDARRLADEGAERVTVLEADLARLTVEAGARGASLADALARLEAARGEGEAREVRLSALASALEETRGELADEREALETAEARAGALGERVEAVAETADDLRAALAEARAERDAALADLEAQREGLDEAEAARLAEAAAAARLRALLADRDAEADEAEAARLAEAAAAETLRARLGEAREAGEAAGARLSGVEAELAARTLDLEAERARAEETLTLLAAARAAEDDLEVRLAAALSEAEASAEEVARLREALEDEGTEALRARLAEAVAAREAAEAEAGRALSEADRQRALLALAAEEVEGARALTSEEAARSEALALQLADLRGQVATLQEALGASEQAEAGAQVEIGDLRGQLNDALARVAADERARAALEAERADAEAERAALEAERADLEAERAARAEAEAQTLARFQSNFFAALADILAGQEGVRVVGDRFVFSSEVLFEAGSAQLSPEGREEIGQVAALLSQVADAIPDGVDWIVRVDGHTDDTPLSGQGAFADNWELSQARALSVVRYMSESLGIPPERLSANGFGEHRPLDPRDTPEARAANRRIELKFTER